MAEIFLDMTNVIVYMDDIALITKGSFEDYLKHLDKLLDRLRKKNLQINGPKSTFCTTEAEFLGFVLTCKGVKPQLNKVEAVLKLQTPRNVKQIRSL